MNRFFGATESNGLVILAPWYAKCVGVFNPSTNSFSCVDISGTIDDYAKFGGATTTSSGLVVFALGIFEFGNELPALTKRQVKFT